MVRVNFWKISQLFVLLALFSLKLQAEDNSSVKNLYLEHISVKEGLSQGTVNSVLASRSGFIWLATDNGLNIYDGYTIKQLPGPNNRFIDESIYLVKQDSQGGVWINVDDGLYRFQPKNNQYQQVFQSDEEHYVVDVVEGTNSKNDNGYWIATAKTIGFYLPDKEQFQNTLDLSKELLDKNIIYQIKYHQQILYVATRIGVYAYNVNTAQWRKLPSLAKINTQDSFNLVEASKSYALYICEQNNLYIGTNDGVFSVNVKNMDKYIQEEKPLSNYKQIVNEVSVWQFMYEEEQLYIASNKGLHKVDVATQQASFLFGFSDYFDNISDNTVKSLARDNSGVFWLGSETSGVYLWDPSRELISNYRYQKNAKNSLSHNAVWALQSHSDDPQKFWVGTSQGLNLVDKAKGTVEQYMLTESDKSQFTENHIFNIFNYGKNSLLLSTSKGIFRYDTRLKQVTRLSFSDEVDEILAKDHYAVHMQAQRYLWLVYEEKASLVDLQTGEIDTLSDIASVVPLKKIYSFLGLLPNSQTMLFTTNDSLWGYDLDTKAVKRLYQHPDIVASQWGSFDNWIIDKNNVFWLSYPTEGLVGLALPSFKPKYFYHSNNSIIDNNVYSLATDNDGDIWFSTHKGLFLLDSDNQHIRHFSIADGLPAMEFNASAKLKFNDGQLAYGSMEGVSVFNPVRLKNKYPDSTIQIYTTGIEVTSRQLDLPLLINQQEEVQLQYDDVGIRFDFSTLSYADTQEVEFEYKLSGESTVTYPVTTDNRISFPSLPSGQYILSVRAISPVSGEYSAPRQVKIRVSYAPWQSPLAYFVYTFILFVLSFIWLYRRSLQRQRLIAAHEDVKYRENRLQLALVGSNSEVWDWQAHDNLMFGKRIAQELDYVDLATSHSFEQHVELIHPDDIETFLSSWRTFIEENNPEETFSCTYRLKHSKGHWLWYKDLGKIVSVDKHNKPSRITGSYTNITKTRAEEVRSQYYGEAFKQTNDWVLIVNEDFTRVTANQSLRAVFGWLDEDFEFNSNLMGLSKRRWQFFLQLLPSLSEGEHWRGEELVVTDSGDEFHVLVNINVGMSHTTNSLHYVCVFTDISAQKAAEKELRYLANYDHLTDLPNRSLLLERIKHAIESSKRKNTSIALFFIDLDRFKQVNDSLGHDCGDLLLIEVTRRLSELLRVDDTVARIGGDEFVVLLESFRGANQLGQIAQKIIASVEQPVMLQGNKVSIGASIGIALYPDDASDCNALLRHADVAMYHAKQLGRNTFQFFTPRMNFEANERLTKESNVKLAYSNNEFFNYYQPIIDAHTGKATGFELLMRWQSSQGLVAPAGFIGIAEELGLIIPMTEAALERGLVDLKKWHKQRPALYLSVNLSPQHFAKTSLVSYIANLLEEHNLPARLLKIEVTESALLSEPEQAIKTMQALSELGVILALDDFGTGFSSLSYLKRLPLDIIKIDRSFVSGIGIEKTDEAIVDATIVLAKRLNMHCIAEGVETTEQLEYLTNRDCHYIQGYLYSKPVDEKTICDYLSVNTVELKAT
ncbi:MAG: EAL domain-containing protein [Colwellia sp.]|nr:EAL domain-containing protein [Colwellia sp.]